MPRVPGRRLAAGKGLCGVARAGNGRAAGGEDAADDGEECAADADEAEAGTAGVLNGADGVESVLAAAGTEAGTAGVRGTAGGAAFRAATPVAAADPAAVAAIPVSRRPVFLTTCPASGPAAGVFCCLRLWAPCAAISLRRLGRSVRSACPARAELCV